MNPLQIFARMDSIKTKLIVAACLILALAIGSATFFNLRESQAALTEKVVMSLQGEAETAGEGIAKEVAAMKAVTEFMATDEKLRAADPAAVATRLAELKKSIANVENLILVDLNGRFLSPDGKTGSVADKEYFKEIMQTKATVVSGDPVVSSFSGKLVAVVITPIKGTGGQITGFLAAGTTIDGIKEYVLSRRFGKSGYTYIFGKSGLIFIHPDEKVAMKTNPLTDAVAPELRDMAKAALSGNKGAREYEFAGNDKFAGFSPIPGTAWGVGTTELRSEALEKIGYIRNQGIIIAIVAILLGGILMYFLAAKITRPIINMCGVANKMAEGDLTQAVSIAANDEVGQLSAAFNTMVGNLKILIRQVQNNAEQVAASSQELTASAEQSAEGATQVATAISRVAAGTEKQTGTINHTTTIVERISAQIRHAAETVNVVEATSDKAAQAAAEGGKSVTAAVNQMGNIEKKVVHSAQVVVKLGERSKEIGQIVDTISGIAGQTNLLALNAAIEAARAGEQGRGFAVVAEEVRKLAEQSQDAAKHIADLINEIQQDTDNAVVAMNEGTGEVKVGAEVVNTAGQAFTDIISLVKQVSTQIKNIAAAVQEVTHGSQAIVDAVREIDAVSKETASQTQTVSAVTEEQSASMEEIAASSEELAKLAQGLQAAVAKFRV